MEREKGSPTRATPDAAAPEERPPVPDHVWRLAQELVAKVRGATAGPLPGHRRSVTDPQLEAKVGN